MAERKATTWRRFLGMNVRGTPRMRRRWVRHDIKKAKKRGVDVLVTQEFKWWYYWAVAMTVLPWRKDKKGWRSNPSKKRGRRNPVYGACAVFWKASLWTVHGVRVSVLHFATRGISDNRYLRAVLLRDRATGLRCWFGTTHFVQGGDRRTSAKSRKGVMNTDLENFDKFLGGLVATGNPVIFQADLNIHKNTEAYYRLINILEKHNATLWGEHGVEYLFTIDGKKVAVDVKYPWRIAAKELRTDHEARGLHYRLIERYGQ